MNDLDERPRLTKKGGWIIVTRFIPTEVPIRPFSIFYAKAEIRIVAYPKLLDNLREGYERVEQIYAKINTEYGPVCLRPDEYNTMTADRFGEYLKAVRGGEFSMYFYAETAKGRFKAQSKKLADAVFYCRTRGIPFSEAVLLCTGMVNSPNVFYLRIHEEGLYYFFYEWEVDRLLQQEKDYAERYHEYDENEQLEVVTQP